MHSTNYTDTFITPAADCPVPQPTVPAKPGSVAALQYAQLAAAPYTMTSDDLLWHVACARGGHAASDMAARATFFSKPQACLRASPLVKTHGWALHHDAAGRVALADPAAPPPNATLRPGMRNARA